MTSTFFALFGMHGFVLVVVVPLLLGHCFFRAFLFAFVVSDILVFR